jgi:hypothetical protein
MFKTTMICTRRTQGLRSVLRVKLSMIPQGLHNLDSRGCPLVSWAPRQPQQWSGEQKSIDIGTRPLCLDPFPDTSSIDNDMSHDLVHENRFAKGRVHVLRGLYPSSNDAVQNWLSSSSPIPSTLLQRCQRRPAPPTTNSLPPTGGRGGAFLFCLL